VPPVRGGREMIGWCPMTSGNPVPQAAERLTFFSDAVVAIAITLLAIDLPVPEGAKFSDFWTSVQHDDGHCVAF
jgi:Endosomal/lysosomal potassium channel TMEM175